MLRKKKCFACRYGNRCTRCKDFCQDRIPAQLVGRMNAETLTMGTAPRSICSCEDFAIVNF